jgi:hypothetical protein
VLSVVVAVGIGCVPLVLGALAVSLGRALLDTVGVGSAVGEVGCTGWLAEAELLWVGALGVAPAEVLAVVESDGEGVTGSAPSAFSLHAAQQPRTTTAAVVHAPRRAQEGLAAPLNGYEVEVGALDKVMAAA